MGFTSSELAGGARGTAGQELRRSWTVLLACILGASVGAGAFPLFLIPVIGLRLEAAFGWSRLETSSLTSIGFVGAAMGVPVVGWLNDRWSIKAAALISLCAIGGLLMLAALAPSDIRVWQAGVFALMLLGSGTLSAPFSKIVCGHFHAMRGLALGLTVGAVSFLAAVALPLFSRLIDQGGLGSFFVGAGLAYILILAPVLFWLLPASRGGEAGAAQTAGAPVTEQPPRILWLLGAAAIVMAFVSGTAPHLAAVAADGKHVPPALVGSVFAAVVMLSRPVSGAVIDLTDAAKVAAAASALAALGLLLVAFAGDRYILLSAVLLATAVGAELDIVAFLVSRYVAPARYGRVFGWIYGGVLLAAAAGPVLAALLHDLTGAYRLPFLAAAVLAALSCGIFLMLPPYARHRSAA